MPGRREPSDIPAYTAFHAVPLPRRLNQPGSYPFVPRCLRLVSGYRPPYFHVYEQFKGSFQSRRGIRLIFNLFPGLFYGFLYVYVFPSRILL